MASLVKYVIEKLGKENFHFFSIALFSKNKTLVTIRENQLFLATDRH